jgi:exodeoxyribonuclease V gamma subunit
MNEARQRLSDPDFSAEVLPERMSLFGISTLPPFYVDWLATLSQHISIRIYLLQPCKEYWGEIRTGAEILQLLRRTDRPADQAEYLHLERGHRLLAMLGRQGRDFLRVLQEFDMETDELFLDPCNGQSKGTLLRRLQQDILDLRDRTRREPILDSQTTRAPKGDEVWINGELAFGFEKSTDATNEPSDKPSMDTDALSEGEDQTNGDLTEWEIGDESIRIHSCHGPLRELEVLRDSVLHWLEAEPDLQPRDILVMTPEIEDYAALIHAVFGAGYEEAQRIPYSVADRGVRAEDRVTDAFLRVLQWPGKPITASMIGALIENPGVQARFEIVSTDIPRLREWILKAEIRWGLDATDRGRMGLPEYAATTWRHGLDRLLLGYAMAPGDPFCLEDVDALDLVEGDGAEVLGRFALLISTLNRLLTALHGERSLNQWSEDLQVVLDELFAVDESRTSGLADIREALRRLNPLDVGKSVPREAVVEQLEAWLAEDRRGQGFLGGGVTFCAMKPMRSIPARIVCLLGLNDQSFPRRPPRLSFDLITTDPRPGDESRDNDDRQLFLETLLSARDKLHISYVGQSIRDNSRVPPSVVVSELLDYLVDTTRCRDLPKGETLRDHLLIAHRLQAFHPTYRKGDSRWYTYDDSLTSGPVEKTDSPRVSNEGAVFIQQPLSPRNVAGSELLQVTRDELLDSLLNTSRFFVRKRLQLQLVADAQPMRDQESFQLNPLEQYKLREALVAACLQAEPTESVTERWLGTGTLPLGTPGDMERCRLRQESESFVARLKRHVQLEWGPPRDLEVQGVDWRITGRLIPLLSGGILQYRTGKHAKASDWLRLWLDHLLLAAADVGAVLGDKDMRSTNDPSDVSRFVSRKEIWELAPVSQTIARAVLGDLCRIYRMGWQEPLPFFPKSSMAYVQTVKSPGKISPEKAAEGAWYGSPYDAAERDDPFIQLCFGHCDPDPLNDRFKELSVQILGPLSEHLVKMKESGRAK